jgi:uncharacterized alpha-E superfamily protein
MASEANQETAVEAALLLGSVADPPQPRQQWLESGRYETPWEIASEIQSLVFDEARPASVCASIRSMWQMASVVRDRISIDSWKILSRVRRDSLADAWPGLAGAAIGSGGDVLSLLDTLILDFSAFAGLGTESMTRGPGWRFLDMGRRIERASAAIQLLRSTLVPARPLAGQQADSGRLEEMLLEIADSSMTYRNRYLGALEAAPLIDLLVIDETNPRSIGYQVAALADHVGHLPQDDSSPVLSGEQRATMAATGMLRLADVTALSTVDPDGTRGQLGLLLTRLDNQLRGLSESITLHYLVHATPRRRLGDVPDSPTDETS